MALRLSTDSSGSLSITHELLVRKKKLRSSLDGTHDTHIRTLQSGEQEQEQLTENKEPHQDLGFSAYNDSRKHGPHRNEEEITAYDFRAD